MTKTLFPLWQLDLQEYQAVCRYLGITPRANLFARLSGYLVQAPFRFPPPKGFWLFLARPRLTRFRVARLDFITKLFFPGHPIRHALNAVTALHECDGDGYREMATTATGGAALLSMLGGTLDFVLRTALSVPWLAAQLLVYAVGTRFRSREDLAGKRVLVTGVSRGLGMDLMLHCLEQGAEVVGTVRNLQSIDEVKAWLPGEAPVTLLVADLSHSGALVEALRDARIPADSLRMAILSAGVKHAGVPVHSLDSLRDTFQVNFFAAAEFATWLCGEAHLIGEQGQASLNADGSAQAPARSSDFGEAGHPEAIHERSLVLISSMGRWHGMHFAGGYNASKAALSIWGESLEMELRQSGGTELTVTIVEPGMFDSGMTQPTALTRLLFASRRDVARRIVSGALAGKGAMRPPFWFALLTWCVCLAGRNFRYRLFARAKPPRDRS